MRFVLTLLALILPQTLLADEAQVMEVQLIKTGMVWRIDVTVSHPDTGWDHYANGWEVLDSDGNRLGYRELYHPHVNEQPFTRSLTNLELPDGTREIFVRASDSKHGWSKQRFKVSVEP